MPGQSEQEAYNELSYYTLSHWDPSFIHQYIVDAYAAQHADEKSKSIKVAFALIGLYLHNEKHYSGKEVHAVSEKEKAIVIRKSAGIEGKNLKKVGCINLNKMVIIIKWVSLNG